MLDYTAIGWGGPYTDYTNVEKENSGYAAFSQVDYSLTERLTLTAGLRIDMEKRKADIQANNQSSPNVNIQGDKDFNEWLPKVGVPTHLTTAPWYTRLSAKDTVPVVLTICTRIRTIQHTILKPAPTTSWATRHHSSTTPSSQYGPVLYRHQRSTGPAAGPEQQYHHD